MVDRLKIALVLGGAKCLWDDIAAAREILGDLPFSVVACNDAGAAWSGPLDIWASLHPELMSKWVETRRIRGYEPARQYAYHEDMRVEPRANIVTPYHFERTHQSASSGIFAAKVAMEQGYRAILCGVPLSFGQAHFFDSAEWKGAPSFVEGFKQAAPFLLGRVKSMSGKTREVLGAPDAAWLAGSET